MMTNAVKIGFRHGLLLKSRLCLEPLGASTPKRFAYFTHLARALQSFRNLIIFSLFATLIGCTVRPAGATKGAGDLGQAQGLFAAGAANVDAAITHTDPEGSALLKVAQQQFRLGQAWLARGIDDYAKLAKQNGDLATKLNAERSHWIGYRTRMLGWWVTGLAAVIAAALVFSPLHIPILPIFWGIVRRLQSILSGIWSLFKTLYQKIRGR